MLWTFMDGSFVPHEMLTAGAASDDTPVLLSAGTAPPADVDIIINLAPDVPAAFRARGALPRSSMATIPSARGRARFKAYRTWHSASITQRARP